MRPLCRLAILFSLLLPAVEAVAAGPRQASLDDPVPGATSTSYLDLARQIVPDIAEEGTAWQGFTLDEEIARKLGLDADWPDGLSIEDVKVIELMPSDRPRFAVLFDFGASSDDPAAPALLALYSVGALPELRDVLDVGLDRDTGFSENAVLELGPQSELIVVGNSHWNSEQSYRISTLVLAKSDDLQAIDDVMTFSETICGLSRTQEPRISVKGDGKSSMAAIRVDVLLHDEPIKEKCSDRTSARRDRTITATYRWNTTTGEYKPDSKALERLAAENEKRF